MHVRGFRQVQRERRDRERNTRQAAQKEVLNGLKSLIDAALEKFGEDEE